MLQKLMQTVSCLASSIVEISNFTRAICACNMWCIVMTVFAITGI